MIRDLFRTLRLSCITAILLTISPLSARASQPVSPHDLAEVIVEHRRGVLEFADLAAMAKQRGLRVFLTGGTATALGDFLKHQYLAATGRMSIDSLRIEDKFHNVFLPEQDIDIAITRADGTPETKADVDFVYGWLKKNYPYTVDGRLRWDVLGLKTDIPAGDGHGPRLALSNNPDFSKQNNDSLSIGMIELTDPPSEKDPIVFDLDRRGGVRSIFLDDLAGTDLSFLESPEHMQTRFAREGRNPPILSAIRAIAKAEQYQKKISDEDLKKIRKIIREFDPSTVQSGSYVSNWIQGKGKRLLTHAYDPAHSLQMIEDLGLKKKLIALDPKGVKNAGSLSWWLSKDPAPAEPSTSTRGKTAAELGIEYVAHETDPTVARLIDWRYDRKPRVFRSRRGVPGEMAEHGNGFYTQIGEHADNYLKNSKGHLILMQVDPEAREGVDFVVKNKNIALWKNVDRLSVVPAKISLPNEISCAASIRHGVLSLSTSRMLFNGVFVKNAVPWAMVLSAVAYGQMDKVGEFLRNPLDLMGDPRTWFDYRSPTEFRETREKKCEVKRDYLQDWQKGRVKSLPQSIDCLNILNAACYEARRIRVHVCSTAFKTPGSLSTLASWVSMGEYLEWDILEAISKRKTAMPEEELIRLRKIRDEKFKKAREWTDESRLMRKLQAELAKEVASSP